MYLKTLFQHSKAWFAVVVVFIICQLFINFKKGTVFSPFYHYGMYSEVMKPKESYPIFSISVNGEELKAKDFSAQKWDKVIQPVIYYTNHQQWNSQMFAQVHRLTGISDTAKYFNRLTKNDFMFWYQQYLSEVIGTEAMNVTIQSKNLPTLKDQLKYKIVLYYCIFFYILAVYKLLNGMWMFQVMPRLFMTRFDGFTWLFMKTGIHQWLIFNPEGWALADALFYSLPLIYFLSNNVFRMGSMLVAVIMLIVNWMYVQCYTLYPTNSIEAHTAWLLFPIAFLASNPKTFRLLAEGLRYFFLFFFVSAGVWKIVNGGVFNTQEMTGVLLYQHADLLSNSPDYWQANLLYWLIKHSTIGYIFYLGATLLELSFIVGFLTKKLDNLLIVTAIIFLVFNDLIMRIPYYEVLPFLITLRLGAIRQDLPFSAVRLQSHSQN